MKPSLRSAFVLAAAALAAQPLVSAAPPTNGRASQLGAITPAFVRNTGQADPRARFVSVGGGTPIFFTSNDVRIVDTKRQRSLWLSFIDGAARDIDGEWSTGGHVTVLRHATAAADEPIYRDVVYRNVWRGIDARVSAATKGLKYSFEVAPGADPRAIHLRYSGHDSIELTDAGEIVLDAGGATIIDTKPVAFQQINGRTVSVPVRFVQFESDVAFSVGEYDKTRPLTIDPTLVYSTYLGSSGYDAAHGIAVDATGAAYIVGVTRYSDLPVTPGAVQPAFRGGSGSAPADGFVAKINAAGTHFDYVTYLGGSDNDEATAVGVDAGGNAYVAGFTQSTDFPTTSGAFKTAGAWHDGFLVKLNASGTSLVYATYFGGDNPSTPAAVAVDSSGNAYVVGQTAANNLPKVGSGAGRAINMPADGFLLKFNPAGSQVIFGSFFGGQGLDAATAIAVDNSGHAVVTGWTQSTWGFTYVSRDTGTFGAQPFPAGPTYLSTDGGHTFASVGNWHTTLSSLGFAIDPQQTSTAYQVESDNGLMKTTDSGVNWQQLQGGALNAATASYDIAVHPLSPSILLDGTSDGLLKSFDGGASWSRVLPYGTVVRARFAPADPSIVYAASPFVYKSTNAGTSWVKLTTPTTGGDTYTLAIDPTNPNIVYGATMGGVIKTTNGGASWTLTDLPTSTGFHNVVSIAVDPTSTNVVWAGKPTGEVYRSTDAGATWTSLPASQTGIGYPIVMVFDGGTLYVADAGDINTQTGQSNAAFHTTSDQGATWQPGLIRGNNIPLRAFAAVNGVVYAGGHLRTEAFVQMLDTGGSSQAIMYSTYLGGGLDDYGVGVALDRNGNAVVAVETHSADYPSNNPGDFRQSAVTRLNSDGSQVTVSTFVGPTSGVARGMSIDGNGNAYVTGVQGTSSHGVFVDQINAAGLDTASFTLAGLQSNVGAPDSAPAGIASGPVAGDVFVAGATNTVDFPTTANAPQGHYGSGMSDAFAAKIAFGGPTPPPPPPPSPNLALNKPVTTSSNYSPTYAGVNAVDGSLATRWSSQFSDPQWIYVDLQGRYNITEVKLRWEIAYGSAYQIDVSDDATNWTTIATVAAGDGGMDDLTGLNGTGRYVRMNGIHRGTQYGYSLYEFEVYGAAVTPPPTGDLALHKPVVSSSDFSSDYAAAFAVDGNGGTRWSSQFSDPQWIYVDLGQRYDINRVKLVWETAYALDFQIQISNDATHWVEIARTQNNGLLTNDMGVGGIGRYVRMYGTRRATQWGYSLFSFEVYGDPVTDVDVALHKDVVASSEFSADYHSGFVTDGDPSTRWSSEFSDPQWIYIDLGSIFVINRIKLAWETAYGADYTIELSYDHSSWWNAATITNGAGGVDDLVVGGTARYVRLSGTRRGTEWGYSLWSFEVYGKPGP